MRISYIPLYNTELKQNIKRAQHPHSPAGTTVLPSAGGFDSQSILAAGNISFHGLFAKDINNKSTPEEKLNAAIQSLDNKSIVIFAKDFDTAKELLSQQIGWINFPMEKIYFVKNTFNNGSFAVYKDKNDDKYKIFKLHPLETVMLLEGGTNQHDKNVKYNYVYNADAPVVLKNNRYISFGPYKQESCIKTDLEKISLRFIFEKDVEKYCYLDTKEEIKKYNATRLSSLGTNKGTKDKGVKKIMFSDIGAQEQNIKTLEENVIFPVIYPDFYKGFRINKGILLYGPPRCGKTMLALALANELGINFIKLGANDLTHAHVGKTEENWRNLFKKAIEQQPSIIFIDEFDSIARTRGGLSDTARHQDDIVNQLLTLMSDLEKSDNMVFVIAATNRKDLLDKALIASGRFGLSLEVKMPDLNGIKQIFNINSKDKPLEENIDTDKICQMMFDKNFNGSEVAESFYCAHNCAMERLGIYEKMRNRTVCLEDLKNFQITQQDMENAVLKLAEQKTSDR